MRLTLRLRFHTVFGQELFVTCDHPILGGGDAHRALPLIYADPEHWQITIWVLETVIGEEEINYYYMLKEPDGTIIHEAERYRRLMPERLRKNDLLTLDSWIPGSFYETAFETKAFREVLLEQAGPATLTIDASATHVFRTSQLGLLSLEVQRMPKALGRTFSRPAEAPYLSVVTPGTHDMSSLREWWEEDPQLTQDFFNEELGRPGNAPMECTPELVTAMLKQHLASPAMWSIFQMQDLLGASADLRRDDARAERINVPGNPRHYWRYRMHVEIESLEENRQFNASLKGLLADTGRLNPRPGDPTAEPSTQ